MYLAPVLRPLPADGPVTPAVQRLADAPFSMVRGAPGSYVAERLAGVIDSWGRLEDCVWLRVIDLRHAELATSLATACRHRWWPSDDSEAAALPGARLSEEISRAPEGAVIVLELGGPMTAGAARLVRTIRPALTSRGAVVVAVAESRLRVRVIRAADCIVPASDLLDPGALDGLLVWDHQSRLRRLTGRHTAVLHDVLAVAQLSSGKAFVEAIDTSRSLSTFMARVTSQLVNQLTTDQRSALGVAVVTGYWHPHLGTRLVSAHQLRPWIVPLEQQWGWLRPIWAPALRRELARAVGSRPASDALRVSRTPVTSGGGGGAATRSPTPARAPTPQGTLEARLLGQLEVRVDGSAVSSWHGPRGMSVLRYVLSRRQHACSRDELLEEFWPRVPPRSARNRLQVAVSGLRRAFADTTSVNILEYANGGYRINPDLDVEVDIDLFERGLRTAAIAERAGRRDDARTEYRRAIARYRGDFAVDAPFESWTLLPRESLRIKLADALDRLSRIELADQRIDDCIATAHRMLDIDPCREDAHRLLMRCYASQGRIYQASRQYELCRRVLRFTVDADPAPDTTRLYRSIRGRSASEASASSGALPAGAGRLTSKLS